jgi:Arc/MetJ-type ribon-helix-helix transcriptional regulator
MRGKQRLSASVDAELLHAAQTAVDEGRATSISAWVNDALRLKAEHDRRMQALGSFLATYEAEHGVITEVEIDEAVRRARSRATVVRSAPSKTAKSHRGVA